VLNPNGIKCSTCLYLRLIHISNNLIISNLLLANPYIIAK